MTGTTNRDRLKAHVRRLWKKVPFGVQVGVYAVVGVLALLWGLVTFL